MVAMVWLSFVYNTHVNHQSSRRLKKSILSNQEISYSWVLFRWLSKELMQWYRDSSLQKTTYFCSPRCPSMRNWLHFTALGQNEVWPINRDMMTNQQRWSLAAVDFWISITKQGDNTFGNVRPSVCVFTLSCWCFQRQIRAQLAECSKAPWYMYGIRTCLGLASHSNQSCLICI